MADQLDIGHPKERRGRKRKTVQLWALAGAHGVAANNDCLIVDISVDGAQVAVVTPASLPDNFSLLQRSKSKIGDAEVVWRGDGIVGVKFSDLSPPRAKG